MYILGNSISMNGGSIDLEEGTYKTEVGSIQQTSGDLTIAEGATLSLSGKAAIDAEGTIANSGTITATDANITAGAVTNTGSVTVNGGTFTAATLDNSGEFNVSGKSTIDIDQINGGVRMNGFTGSFDANVKGYVLTYGKSQFSNDFDTQELYVGKKIEDGAKANTDILTVKSGVTLDTAIVYVRGTGVMNIEAGAAVNTSMHFNGSESGGFYNYGTTNISGSLTINGGDGMLIGSSSYADENGVAVINVKQGGTLSVSGVTMQIDSDAALNITSGTFTAGSVTNNGTITIKGNSTINAEITGNAVNVASGAVLNGRITADLALKGNITLNGNYTGSITGNKNITVSSGTYQFRGNNDTATEIKSIVTTDDSVVGFNFYKATVGSVTLKGDFNMFMVTAGAEIGNITIDGTVNYVPGIFPMVQLGDTAITGKNNAVLNISIRDNTFGGNKITGVKLNLTNVGTAADVDINADVALSDIKSINNNAVSSVDGVYFYTAADEKTYILNKVDGGIDIVEATENKDLFEDEMGNFTLEGDLSDFDVTMKSGKTTLKVANGDSAAIGSIDKNDQGGVNNVSVGNGSGLTVGNIERMGNITVGKNGSDMTVTEELTGTSAAETISIGNGSTFNSGNLDFASGKATFKLGKEAEAEINGNYIVYGSSNSITLGADAEMDITGNIINYCGNNYDAGSGTVKYAPISGTTIKLGKGADMTGKDIIGLAGLTLANGSAEKRNKKGVVTAKEVNTTFTADNVYGTEKNNTINVGNYGIFSADNIDLFSGNDTFKIGNDSIVNLGALDFGAGKDTFKIGNDSIVNLGALDFGAGNDTLTIGKNSKLTLDSVSGLETFNATKGASVWFNDMEDVKLEGIKGSWKNATIYDMKGELKDTTSDTEWIAEIYGWTYGNERDFYTFKVTGEDNNEISVIGADSNNIVMLYENVNDSWNEVGMLSPLNIPTQPLENGQYAVAVYVVGADMNKNNNSLEDNAYSFGIKLA